MGCGDGVDCPDDDCCDKSRDVKGFIVKGNDPTPEAGFLKRGIMNLVKSIVLKPCGEQRMGVEGFVIGAPKREILETRKPQDREVPFPLSPIRNPQGVPIALHARVGRADIHLRRVGPNQDFNCGHVGVQYRASAGRSHQGT